ncbi:hypothetical protein TEA_025649 [Camellia sinensis var. sinensis]|uniref:Uncharacterized protein n=1 Tax=Camellia sinensis var. sinensis TaxID=542762 RepID=A0A4S4F1A9_CAMSN|nr:hypothetical protein TEA_025649 [Camellia sinensis var. sinensis]
MTVSYLQSDNALLENKQKELKGTINNLLQSRESFVKVYEGPNNNKRSTENWAFIFLKTALSLKLIFSALLDSTFEMKQSIQTSDRKVTILSQKINAHLLLFDSIEKEAFSVKQVLDNVQHLALQLELRSLGIILQKIQDTVTNMNEEDRRAFSSVLGGQKECTEIKEKENIRIEDAYQNTGENSPSKAGEGGSEENTASVYKEHDSVNKRLQGNNNMECCISEASGFFSCF